MSSKVPCPKCKGGCALCSGSGLVPELTGQMYSRAEARTTIRVKERSERSDPEQLQPQQDLEPMFPAVFPTEQDPFPAEEPPTRPDRTTRRYPRVRRWTIGFERWIVIACVTVSLGFLIAWTIKIILR